MRNRDVSCVAYPRAAYGHRLDVRSSNYRDRLVAVATGIAWLTTVINALDVLEVLIGRIQTRYNRFVNSPAARGGGRTSIDIPTGLSDNRFGTGEIHLILTVRKLKFPKRGCAFDFVELRTADSDGAALAGFYDLAWYVEGVSKVLPAVRFAAHAYVDVRAFNAQLYRVYADAVAEGRDRFEFDVGPVTIRVAPDPELKGRWFVTIITSEGEEKKADDLIPDFSNVCAEDDYRAQLDRLVETLTHTRITVDAFSDLRHILVERATRFPARLRDAESGELLDPALVRDSIIGSANAAIAANDLGRNYYRLPSESDPTSNNAAQIAFPVVLPDAPDGRAEIFGVFRLDRDFRGFPKITIPTVLSRASIGHNHTVYNIIRDVWRKRQRFGNNNFMEVA